MMTFLENNNFSSEAKEGVVEMLFGDLTPEEAIKLNEDYSLLTEEDKMRVILKRIVQSHIK